MSALAALVLLAGPALAQEAACDAECVMDRALRLALADAGLSRVDRLDLHTDRAGQLWVDITSADRLGLSRIGPVGGAITSPARGSYVRTVPVGLTGIDSVTLEPLEAGVDYLLEIDGIDGGDGDAGGGGGGSSCEEVCVCTEDGPECWMEC